MLNPGVLQERVTIQANTHSVGMAGGVARQWSDVATVPARVRQVSGREFLAAGATQTAQTAVFTIRWRDGLDETMRLVWDGRPFDLVEIRRVGRRAYLELHARAAVPTGAGT